MISLTHMERQIIQVLMKNEGFSRFEISKSVGSNAGTVWRAVNRLIRKQYVQEGEQISISVGRPWRALTLNPALGYMIGLDLEATNVRGALVDFALNTISQRRFPLPLDCSTDRAGRALLKMYRTLSAKAGRRRILGVGVGIPGFCEATEGRIISYDENPSWAGFAVKKRLAREIAHPLFAEHNAVAVTLGENWFHYHGKINNLICVVIRAGVAAGFVINGLIFRGAADGGAGEIAHLKVRHGGEICSCGQRGCLRQYVSGRALAKKMTQLGLGADEKGNTLLALAELANKGRVPASKLVHQAGQSLGMAIGHMVNILGTKQVVISSDLTKAGQIFLAPLESELQRAVPQSGEIMPKVRFSSLDGYAGALGAAVLASQEICGIYERVA